MENAKEIIAAIEAMNEVNKQNEKEIGDLRIEIWKKDEEIDNLRKELKKWKEIALSLKSV